jgi:acetyl esterase/lipase
METLGPELGVDAFAIGGESAGAHLAAATLLRLRAADKLAPIRAALLHYGCYDLRMTPSMANWGPSPMILSTPTVDWFTLNLTGGDDALRSDPVASPLLSDLHGMPPALFQCGTLDPLIDDTLFMAQRWLAAGAESEMRLYPGAVHAFDMFDLPVAREARAAAAAFLRARLG